MKLLRVSAEIMRRNNLSCCASSCCQMRKTVQPLDLSSLVTMRSRALFLVTLAFQYGLLLFGNLKCFGHPCQKQPSTKTATLDSGKAKSGRPGKGRCLRHPTIRCFQRIFSKRPSVSSLPNDRIAAITTDRLCLLNMSAIGGPINPNSLMATRLPLSPTPGSRLQASESKPNA